MANYLGETPVNIATHSEFSTYTPSDWAMYFIHRYSGIDGQHHQLWLVDQVARILKGTPIVVEEAAWDDGTTEYLITTGEPSYAYNAWVQEMLGEWDEEWEEYEYTYDVGIAP